MNVANALGVWVLLKEFGLSDQELAHGLGNFSGVTRRQQVVGEAAGVVVIDDFAHHPTAISATLEAVAERYPKRRSALVKAWQQEMDVRRAAWEGS